MLPTTHHREMQIKTTVRCHSTPIRMTTKEKKQVLVSIWKNWNPWGLL
jgi:hypothetical protein